MMGMTNYKNVRPRRTTGNDGQNPVRMLCAHGGGPMLILCQAFGQAFGKGADGSKVARFSIFCTGGVGAFGTIGFTGTMDNTLPHLALPGVLQREQAVDSS